MKPSLFTQTEGEGYTPKALDIDIEFRAAIEVVFKRHASTYPIRELMYIAQGAIQDVGLSTLLGWDDQPQPSVPTEPVVS